MKSTIDLINEYKDSMILASYYKDVDLKISHEWFKKGVNVRKKIDKRKNKNECLLKMGITNLIDLIS